MIVPTVTHVAVVAAHGGGKLCVFTLADGGFTINGKCSGSRFEDGEVQRDDGVTAVDSLEGVRKVIAAFGDVGVIVPVERIALHSGGVTSDIVVDGEMQRHDGVAAVNVGTGKSVRVFAAFRDSLFEPVEGFASGGRDFACGGLVHRELQGVRAGTIVVVVVFVNMRAVGGVARAVPGKALAGTLCFNIVCAVVDGEVEGYHTVCATNGGKGLLIVAGGSVN